MCTSDTVWFFTKILNGHKKNKMLKITYLLDFLFSWLKLVSFSNISASTLSLKIECFILCFGLIFTKYITSESRVLVETALDGGDSGFCNEPIDVRGVWIGESGSPLFSVRWYFLYRRMYCVPEKFLFCFIFKF